MSRRRSILAYVVGVLLTAYGCWLLVSTRPLPDLLSVFWWLAGGLVAHDGVLAPLTVLAGLGISRVVPARVRAPIQAGLFATAAVSLAALALVLGFGRRPDNPSLLPLPYGRNLLLLLTVIWAAVALLCLVPLLFRRRRRRRGSLGRVR